MVPRGGAREGAGRKPKGPEKLTSLLKVLLMPSVRNRLEDVAHSQGTTPSELARDFIEEGLNRQARRRGKTRSKKKAR